MTVSYLSVRAKLRPLFKTNAKKPKEIILHLTEKLFEKSTQEIKNLWTKRLSFASRQKTRIILDPNWYEQKKMFNLHGERIGRNNPSLLLLEYTIRRVLGITKPDWQRWTISFWLTRRTEMADVFAWILHKENICHIVVCPQNFLLLQWRPWTYLVDQLITQNV